MHIPHWLNGDPSRIHYFKATLIQRTYSQKGEINEAQQRPPRTHFSVVCDRNKGGQRITTRVRLPEKTAAGPPPPAKSNLGGCGLKQYNGTRQQPENGRIVLSCRFARRRNKSPVFQRLLKVGAISEGGFKLLKVPSHIPSGFKTLLKPPAIWEGLPKLFGNPTEFRKASPNPWKTLRDLAPTF